MVRADFAERRAHPRLVEDLRARYRIYETEEVLAGWIVNLSAGGAALRSEVAIPERCFLADLRFSLPSIRQQAGAEVAVAAIVLRTRPEVGDDGVERYVSGLHFLNLEGEAFERVRSYVFYRLREQGERAPAAAATRA